MADQYLDNIKSVLATLATSDQKEVLKEELKDLYEKDLLKDLWNRYRAIQSGEAVKTGNKTNSMVAFVLGITTKKPTDKFKIEKRRVYARSGFPDVDMDFCYLRRKEILVYLKEKYGEEQVANIGTLSVLHVKSAVRKVIKVLDPENTIEYDSNGKQIVQDGPNRGYQLEQEIINSLPSDPILMTDSGEKIESVEHAYNEFPLFKKYMDQYPEVYEAAKKLEGKIQSFGIHAAGIVISPVPFSEICPLHSTSSKAGKAESKDETRGRNKKGEKKSSKKKPEKKKATQYSMKDVESLGLIKFDVLALATLTAVDWCIKDLKKEGYKIPEMDSFPLDDKETLKMLTSGYTNGCFQLEMPGMQKTLKEVKIDSFNDLVAVVAMYRPGPKQFIPMYADRKRNKDKVKYVHPIVEKHTSDTFGAIVYQEQCMQIFVDLADLTNSDGYKFIKGSAKKDPKLFMSMKDIFIRGATKMVGKEIAVHVFKQMEPFSGYAFNKTLHFSEGIATSKGEFTIEELFRMKEKKIPLPQVFSPVGNLINIVDVYDHGVVPMYKVMFSDGTEHKCTIHHKFETDIGVLPLCEIIKRNAKIFVNKGVYSENKKKSHMYSMQSDYEFIQKTKKTQEQMRQMEKMDEDSTSINKQGKCKETLGNHDHRKNGNLSRENVEICFEVDSRKQRREKTKIESNVRSQSQTLRYISEKSNNNCHQDIGQAGDSGSKNTKPKKVERKQSTGFLRKMHKAVYATKELAVCSREVFNNFIKKIRFQTLSNNEKQGIYNKIETKTNRLYEPDQKNNSRIRWRAALSRWIRRETQRCLNKRQRTKQGSFAEKLHDNKNIVRCVDTTKEEVQVHRNAIVNQTYFTRKNKTKRSFHRSQIQVTGLEYIGFCQGYDLEVDSKDHLYCLSSGVVNSNSHAVSYAYFSFVTAWLKTHFPLQFLCNRLSVEAINKNFDDVVVYERDAKRLGIEILPPDINKSKIKYSIEGESSIRKSLLVKDVGIKAAQTIVDNQPYTGKDILLSFGRKVGKAVNKRVMEGMYRDGMWDFTGLSLEKLMSKFETIRQDKKKNQGKQFGDMFE